MTNCVAAQRDCVAQHPWSRALCPAAGSSAHSVHPRRPSDDLGSTRERPLPCRHRTLTRTPRLGVAGEPNLHDNVPRTRVPLARTRQWLAPKCSRAAWPCARAQQVIREDHSLDEVIETEDDGGASNFVSVISTAVKQAKSSKKRWNKAQHALRARERLPLPPLARACGVGLRLRTACSDARTGAHV